MPSVSQFSPGDYRLSSSTVNLVGSLLQMNRVHAGPDTSLGQQLLAEHYPEASVIRLRAGTSANGWLTPPGWTCETATLTSPSGDVLVDASLSPLSVFAFSPSFTGWLSREELEPHLFSNPGDPHSVPFHFRNQYSHENPQWGFSLPHSLRAQLEPGDYFVNIEVTWDRNATLDQCELIVEGASEDTLLLLGHFDHPYQLNDGLIGVMAAFEVAQFLSRFDLQYSYRALSLIEIVGSSLLLSTHPDRFESARAALFLTLACAPSRLAYQTTFFGDSYLDRAIAHTLSYWKNADVTPHEHRSLIGNDENVFDAAHVDIPTATLLRWPFPQYHTDGDNFETFDPGRFEDFVRACLSVIHVLESNRTPNLVEAGLPRLKSPQRDLYLSPASVSKVGSLEAMEALRKTSDLPTDLVKRYGSQLNLVMRNTIRMSDGRHSILDIAERSKVPFELVETYVSMLASAGVLEVSELRSLR